MVNYNTLIANDWGKRRVIVTDGIKNNLHDYPSRQTEEDADQKLHEHFIGFAPFSGIAAARKIKKAAIDKDHDGNRQYQILENKENDRIDKLHELGKAARMLDAAIARKRKRGVRRSREHKKKHDCRDKVRCQFLEIFFHIIVFWRKRLIFSRLY
jgi:hypothetical protein